MKALKSEKIEGNVILKTYPGGVKTMKIKTGEFTLSVKRVYLPVIFNTEAAALYASNMKFELLRDLFKLFGRKYLDLKFLKEVNRFIKK